MVSLGKWCKIRTFSVLIMSALLVLYALDYTGAGLSTAKAQTVPQVSPQLRALIGSTDCLSSKGFNLTAFDTSLMGQLQTTVGGGATFSCHATTGKVRFFITASSKPVPAPANLAAQAKPEQAARAFMGTYGTIFGLKDQATELNLMANLPAARGTTFVRFQQVQKGIPVVAGEIIVQVGSNNGVISVGGELTPEENLDFTTSVSEVQAQDTAKSLAAKLYKLQPANLFTTPANLRIYNPGLLNSQPGSYSQPVWQMTVSASNGLTGSEPFEEVVLVDIKTGRVALHFNRIAELKDRRICSQPGFSQVDCTNPVRTEGQLPTGIADVDHAYDYAGATYDFYFNNFGRDSLDGMGFPLKNTVCPSGGGCNYQNAFWSFTQKQMYYATSYASADDVVGHEMTHGLTQFTSNLVYLYQSGAINESLSDVFGEFIDQTDGLDGAAGSGAGNRWLLGEDLPIGAVRNMKNPPAFSNPDKISSSFYDSSSGDQGGVHTNSGVNNKAAYLIVDGTSSETGGSFNGQTITGIGIAKAAQIYYEVETHLLTSGSDYQDLYDYLPQACQNLSGTYSITAADCAQVKKAVVATEMNLTPAGDPADAPACSNGNATNDLFFDNMENPASANWSFAATTGGNAWNYSIYPLNTSGTHHLEGTDLDTLSVSAATMTNGVLIPANSFMRFRNNYTFEGNNDGGVVEYSTDGGSSWLDAAALFDTNGYNGTISSSGDNPLAGRSAFTNSVLIYYSSRLNLSSLSGRTLRFRFRIGTDSSFGELGWLIDDVRIYTCDAPSICLTVTSSADDGSCGTLRMAVTTANAAGSGGIFKTIDMSGLPANTTIQLTGSGLTLNSGDTINGPPCSANGPVVTISGTGITGAGLSLNGATLNNVKVTGFNGVQIKANQGRNKLSCVKAVH